MSEVVVRRRTPADIATLGEVLFAQQSRTRYPFRDPLPIPVAQFLHADDALAAWTATVDDVPVGHVCRTGPPTGSPDADEMNVACAAAHGCRVEELGWVNTLFVGTGVRGLGVGRLLLETVVADLREHDLRPCLEVLAVHDAAARLYLAAGWREVHRLRPAWLREAAGPDEAPDVAVMVL